MVPPPLDNKHCSGQRADEKQVERNKKDLGQSFLRGPVFLRISFDRCETEEKKFKNGGAEEERIPSVVRRRFLMTQFPGRGFFSSRNVRLFPVSWSASAQADGGV